MTTLRKGCTARADQGYEECTEDKREDPKSSGVTEGVPICRGPPNRRAGPSKDAVSIETLHHALSIGVTFWDTADMYGSGHNERLIGQGLCLLQHLPPWCRR
jgi:hypothetical protein